MNVRQKYQARAIFYGENTTYEEIERELGVKVRPTEVEWMKEYPDAVDVDVASSYGWTTATRGEWIVRRAEFSLRSYTPSGFAAEWEETRVGGVVTGAEGSSHSGHTGVLVAIHGDRPENHLVFWDGDPRAARWTHPAVEWMHPSDLALTKNL